MPRKFVPDAGRRGLVETTRGSLRPGTEGAHERGLARSGDSLVVAPGPGPWRWLPRRPIARRLTLGRYRHAVLQVWLLGAAACNIPTFTPEVEPLFETFGPPVRIAEFDNAGRYVGSGSLLRIIRNETAWRQLLPLGSFQVARRGATELAFSGAYNDFDESGVYRCVACATALFSSHAKYDSKTGWPSFWVPIAASNVTVSWSEHWGLRRREVQCARCSAHLGHVFNDGPLPSRRRYCINSAALAFSPSDG